MELFLFFVGVGVVCWIVYKIYEYDQKTKQAKYDQACRTLSEAKSNAAKYNVAISEFSELTGFRDSEGKLAKAKQEKHNEEVRVCKAQLREIDDMITGFRDDARTLLGLKTLGIGHDSSLSGLSASKVSESFNSKYTTLRDSFAKTKPIAERLDIALGDREEEIKEFGNILPHLRHFAEDLTPIENSYMLSDPCREYGKPRKQFYDGVKGLSARSALSNTKDICDAWHRRKTMQDYTVLCSFKPLEMAQACWKLAMTVPFPSDDFKRVSQAFDGLVSAKCRGKHRNVDVLLADLYSRNAIAGEDSICASLNRNLGKGEFSRSRCPILASFFMWIDASKAETIVLEYMLTNGIDMTPKMQERLHTLKKSGGKSAKLHEVASVGDSLFFDTSSVGWNEESLQGFFGNLQFQEKSLTYSLALRENENTLTLPNATKAPSMASVGDKIKSFMLEEYGNEVEASLKRCVAISGNNEEHFEGLLVTTKACSYLGILAFVIPIGRKLTIKQYTLYMPTSKKTESQAIDAESLHSQTSPITKVWETNLMQNTLSAIEALLNEDSEIATSASAPITASSSSDVMF